MTRALILDAYTVEPSGLGVPPYLSGYVRYAYSELQRSGTYQAVDYVTIDDYRRAVGQPEVDVAPGRTNAYTYSLTVNADRVLDLLASADLVVVVAGDAVPSYHLHAVNGSIEEIEAATARVRGAKVLVGPMSSYLRMPTHSAHGAFDAFHAQTFSADNLLRGSAAPLPYGQLGDKPSDYGPLVAQIPWAVVAEIELYRGCTRRNFCSFCNEPVKNPTVEFRDPDLVLAEVESLYEAGVRHFRLGQQTCFFSYFHRDVERIEYLLSEIRTRCPRLEMLHIDNVDPLAAASANGRRIAKVVAQHCTEGNAAPMGVETFDPAVVAANKLTVTPEILQRAIENIEEYGAERGPLGYPKFLAGLNIIYGMPGQTRRTHLINMEGLLRIFENGHQCHRTNVRPVRVYDGTPLQIDNAGVSGDISSTFDDDFKTWCRDISQLYDVPMKQRVYPVGHELRGMHAFFLDDRGTWFRRLGSYAIQVLSPARDWDLYSGHDVTITGHQGRYLLGTPSADLATVV